VGEGTSIAIHCPRDAKGRHRNHSLRDLQDAQNVPAGKRNFGRRCVHTWTQTTVIKNVTVVYVRVCNITQWRQQAARMQDRRAPTQCTDDTTFDLTKNENKTNTVFAKPKGEWHRTVSGRRHVLGPGVPRAGSKKKKKSPGLY
jgi:hypothetical protein